MRFAFSEAPTASAWYESVREGLREVFVRHGHEYAARPDEACGLVFHPLAPERPRPHPRKSRATFVVGLAELGPGDGDLLHRGYPLLVRSISNTLLATRTPDPAVPLREAALLTPERGCYPAAPASAPDPFDELYRRLAPLACSHLVIDNLADPDLPPELWAGTPATDDVVRASRRLEALHLLPAPFPIDEVLDPQGIAYLRRLYGIGGLSYGNLSRRHDATRFWMSASGVHKGSLGQVGGDILLVKGYDPELNAIRLSVRPDLPHHRVSVDAIEHTLIYGEHPAVGAILHVHAWVDGVPTTQINYPCGTIEMGRAVADVLRQCPDPGRAVIGLRNHGITATGPDLRDILDRLQGRVQTTVPMQ